MAARSSRDPSHKRGMGWCLRKLRRGSRGRSSLPYQRSRHLRRTASSRTNFGAKFGPDYRADLDLVFANPDGTPLKPDSISAAVSALFTRLKIPKPKGAALHLLRHTDTSVLLAQRVPLAAGSARFGHSSVGAPPEI